MDLFVRSVLYGMRLSQRAARLLFPRALELVSRAAVSSDCRHQFQLMTAGKCDARGSRRQLADCRCANSSSLFPSAASASAPAAVIPVWQFVQWIPQLLSTLGLPSWSLAAPILQLLARSYPQALYFPFHLSRATLRDKLREGVSSSSSAALDASLSSLSSLLSFRLIPLLVDALDGLTAPEIKFGDMLREFTSAAHKQQSARALAVWADYRSAWLAGKKEAAGGAAAAQRADVGPVNALFVRKYRKQIEALFAAVTRDGLPSAAAIKELNAKGKQLVQEAAMDREMGSKRKVGIQSLSSYSQWLTAFQSHAAALHEEVEVPGQYGGDSEPQPEQHVRIRGFARDVLVLNSIRKPKRLTLLGSDEREYPYLLKGGEDLRLDERIEQLFTAMNDIIAADRRCAARRLSLMTYAVVPLTPKLGWIEWLPDTVPVKAVIRDTAGAEAADASVRAMLDMIASLAPNAKGNDAQNDVIEKVPAARLVQEFSPLLELLPCDLFSRHLLRLSSCPEAFLLLRSRLAHSFAAVSMSQYVLGIGDRHTDNFLFHRRSGQLAAIDFGMAFGQGALLPIPELMPIRFTRQFQHILSPLQTRLMLADDMELLMLAFSAQQQRLLTMMEVFVNEPHVEWIEAAKSRQQQQQQTVPLQQQASPSSSSSSLDAAVVWYPRRKLAIARAKLNAANPCEVTKEELSENCLFTLPQRKGLQAACYRAVDGSELGSRRSQVGRWCSGAREQVDCLIEQATDINILGRTYCGWTPQW